MDRVPVNDTIIYSLARLVDDAQKERRDPSHSDIEFQLDRAGLSHADPSKAGRPIGKAKTLRTDLHWDRENDIANAEKLAVGIISSGKGCGGFRASSPNCVGANAIANLSAALR